MLHVQFCDRSILDRSLGLMLLFLLALPAQAAEPLRMVTVDALDDSGLLTVLNEAFEQHSGIEVEVNLTGTVRALTLAEDGEVDVVLVRNPELEQAFVDGGHGVERHPVMYSDFVVLGAGSDPSRISELDSAGMILRRITLTQMPFVSHGNGSVPYRKELELWAASRLQPGGRRYMVAGSNLRRLFEMAQHYQAYTLLERRDYLTYKDRTNLHLLYENDPLLYLPYHVIAVNADSHPEVRSEQAQAYIDFITGSEGQQLINEFRFRDEPIFFPGSPPAE